MKKVLVLDKSAVKAAPGGFLKNLGADFDFLLPDILLHEIATEKLDKRSALSAPEQVRLDNMIRANFRRTIEEAGNHWIDNETALSWEITQGSSARHALRMNLLVTPSIDMLSQAEQQLCLDGDAKMGMLMSVVHAPADQPGFDEIRSWGEEKLFRELRVDYSSERVLREVARDAKTWFADVGLVHGLVVHPDFAPGADWLSFGMTLVMRAYLPWKFWKWGDGPAQPKNPANPFYDMVTVGYVTIADGLLSADKDLLKMAWACWPEKESHIYEFDYDSATRTHRFRVFQPESVGWAGIP